MPDVPSRSFEYRRGAECATALCFIISCDESFDIGRGNRGTNARILARPLRI
jgi:hypothetical protein